MLRRILVVLTVLVLVGVMFGCASSTEKRPSTSVMATDARMMVRDAVTIMGLNRNSCYSRYDVPSYIDGH